MRKPDEEEEGPKRFGDEGKQRTDLGDHDEISSGRMKKGRLNNLPSLEGDSTAHEDEEDCGEGDDSQSSNLKEEHGDHLTQCRQILSDIDDDKTCDTDGRSGSEKGIDKTERTFGC